MEPRKIAEVELPAIVRVRGAWFVVLATHGELILDYQSYDPTYDPSQWEADPLGGLLRVEPRHGFRFLANLDERVFPIGAARGMVALNGERARPVVLVDFDTGIFVSSHYDQALETLCGEAWAGSFGDPLREIPAEIAAGFNPDDGATH